MCWSTGLRCSFGFVSCRISQVVMSGTHEMIIFFFLFLIYYVSFLVVFPLEQSRGVWGFRRKWKAMWSSLTPSSLIPVRPSNPLSHLTIRDSNYTVTPLSFIGLRHFLVVRGGALVVTMMRHQTWEFYDDKTPDMSQSWWRSCSHISRK